MLTKGIIKSGAIVENITNGSTTTKAYKYKVQLFIFSNASDTNSDANIISAICCYSDCFKGYQIGDCVIVGFEDNLYSKPIILGKLFTGQNDEDSSYLLKKRISDLESEIDKLQAQVNTLLTLSVSNGVEKNA